MTKKLKILKFGGSSISNSKRIKRVVDIILQQKKESDIAIIISALGGITNQLDQLANFASNEKSYDHLLNDLIKHHTKIIDELFSEGDIDIRSCLDKYFDDLESDLSGIYTDQHLTSESRDKILSYGELFSCNIISQYLSQKSISAELLDARKVVLTDDHYGNAYVYYQKSYNRIRAYCKNRKKTQIITGFIGSTENGDTTTLGRSGSDYSAAIFGAALNATAIEIWTDVNGILSADPTLVSDTKTIPHLTYEEAMELAHAGAKVIFPPTMIPALYKSIPIYIKNTFELDNTGTTITKERSVDEYMAAGISSLYNISLIRFQGAGMVGRYGVIGRIFNTLAKKKINIILVSQVFSEHSICFAIRPEEITIAKKLMHEEFSFELDKRIIDSIKIENNLSLIAVVGERMRHTPGISGEIFSILGRENVNIIAIAQGSSERNISFIINNEDSKHAIRTLHTFLFGKQNPLNLFVVGTGLVGSALIKLIKKNGKINVCGISNSRKMILNQQGLSLKNYIKELENGESSDLDAFITASINSPRSVLIDVTSSSRVAKKTTELIENGVSVVSASKLANTMNMNYYNSIRKKSYESGAQFKYEANVGAGLPIIETLQNLIKTDDVIEKIEGIISGTLGYLFCEFDGLIPFSELVKNAKEKGFTEPDPRDDLNGIDVGRKILILARETGAYLEMSDVIVENLIPSKMNPDLSIDEFLNQLSDHDQYFQDQFELAKKENKVLRYIAEWDGKTAQVQLKAVGQGSPFYHQYGRENFIIFTTKRYHNTPLVIKGHGAGAEVTAAGVLGDILKCQ